MLIYISEIKNRIILTFLTFCSTILIEYFYKEVLLFLFLESEISRNYTFKINYFIFTDVTEIFLVYFKLMLFISFQISFFYTCYHIFVFLSHGVFITEYRNFTYVLKFAAMIWVLSLIISKYVLIPMMWDFFFNFQNSRFMHFHFEAKLNEYLDFYIKFYYIFIVYCQTFTLLFIFFIKINNILLIKKFRKLFYYFFVLFSTCVSPPEVFSQLVLSFILIFFFEFFIFVITIKRHSLSG
jgi:sec-independent protein translocase protein TatC